MAYRAKTSEHEILEAMERFGGGFVVALSRCFRAADRDNQRILMTGFQKYFQQYDELAALRSVRSEDTPRPREEPRR